MKLPIWLAALLVPAIPILQHQLDAYEAKTPRPAVSVMTAAQVRRVAPGLDLLMADLYWLRTVQHFGGRSLRNDSNLDLIDPLIAVTTDLDPRLEIAYRYGAVFLGDTGGANRPDDAIALLEKGVRLNPLSWKLRQDLGFYHFLYKADAETAARVLQEAARLPGAPFWLETLGASLLEQGGLRDKARVMWKRMYEQAEAPSMRDNAAMHLAKLAALDQIDVLHHGIQEYHRRHGRFPTSLEELATAGLMGVPPVDPLGTPFRYDPETGVVQLGADSTLPRS